MPRRMEKKEEMRLLMEEVMDDMLAAVGCESGFFTAGYDTCLVG